MAYRAESVTPLGPNIVQNIQGMTAMPAWPHGAADTGPRSPPEEGDTTPWFGRCGARCFRTQIGPRPGPPPPCGMLNVLCRLRWHTSAPIMPGEVKPNCAFMLAPSMYTWPPLSWTAWHISWILSSKKARVDGYVTMKAASRSLFASQSALNSARSMPAESSIHLISMSHMAAEAGFVPCAERGMMHTLREPCPMLARYCLITRSPAYSPEAPLVGCSEQASNPVQLIKYFSKDSNNST
mmetsp:Transcript_91931/g.281297  ORF Transcript_91931/g.281297 Transcript_91931/m.281297 type:complete len:239 (-) Transcript_91931:1870-2586(-)